MSWNKVEMIGKKFGMLTVVSEFDKNKSGNVRWLCRCDCGKESIVVGSKLRNGHTKSCGCLKISPIAQGYSATRLYSIWTNMHRRCYNKNHDAYNWYGLKGIVVCEEWHEFIPFREWALSNGYKENLSIDRIDSTGNYEPSNCRWQNQKQQMNNVSSNHIIAYKGKKYTMAQFSNEFNLRYWTVNNRLRAGWDVEKIISTPENEACHEV